METAMALSII